VSATYVPRTKIVCTLGPATATEDAIRSLVEAGMNVARLNFSHGTHSQHVETIALVRRVADEMRTPVAILGDLQGPRIRVGDIPGTIYVEAGEDLVLVHEGLEKEGEIPITYDHLADDVHVGDRILIDAGLIELLAMDVSAQRVRARVVHGGPITPHKGLNLPGVHVSAPSITEKDITDVHFAVEQGLDYLALSFVRRARDIEALRAMIPKGLLIVAKIEKDVALSNIEIIIQASDL
jgi:pyruvate kinase